MSLFSHSYFSLYQLHFRRSTSPTNSSIKKHLSNRNSETYDEYGQEYDTYEGNSSTKETGLCRNQTQACISRCFNAVKTLNKKHVIVIGTGFK